MDKYDWKEYFDLSFSNPGTTFDDSDLDRVFKLVNKYPITSIEGNFITVKYISTAYLARLFVAMQQASGRKIQGFQILQNPSSYLRGMPRNIGIAIIEFEPTEADLIPGRVNNITFNRALAPVDKIEEQSVTAFLDFLCLTDNQANRMEAAGTFDTRMRTEEGLGQTVPMDAVIGRFLLEYEDAKRQAGPNPTTTYQLIYQTMSQIACIAAHDMGELKAVCQSYARDCLREGKHTGVANWQGLANRI